MGEPALLPDEILGLVFGSLSEFDLRRSVVRASKLCNEIATEQMAGMTNFRFRYRSDIP